MREKQVAIPVSLIFIFILLLTAAAPAYAMKSIMPDNSSISSLEDLLEWYSTSTGGNQWPMLTEDVIVNRPVKLAETSALKDLGAIEHILRVTAGGSLELDNPKLAVQGPGTVIVVEPGGKLLLKNGAIYTAPGADSIVVEKGGKLIQSEVFHIEGNVLDKNTPPVEPDQDPVPDTAPNPLPPTPGEKPEPESPLPSIPDEKPEPEPPLPPTPDEKPEPPALPAIKNIIGFDDSLSCMVGEPPLLSEYPATARVTYQPEPGVPSQKELPVIWELDTVDFDTVGIYQVKGVFTADVLAANGLSNPNGISPTLQLTVLKPSPIDTLTGNVLSVERDGSCRIQLAMPPLPAAAAALYLYRSADGIHWQKVRGEIYTDESVISSWYDFLPYSVTTPTKLYVVYRYKTDYRSIWLRVEVVGSAVAGLSNEIKLEMPFQAKPGEGIHTGNHAGDGSSEGNRGGGGQSESGRELPGVQENPTQGGNFPTKHISSVNYNIPHGLSEQIPAVSQTGEMWDGQTTDGGTSDFTTASEVTSGGKTSIPAHSDTGQEEAEAASPSDAVSAEDSQEAAASVLSNQTPGSPPLQRSRGVPLTAGATAVVAGGLFILKKINNRRKRRP